MCWYLVATQQVHGILMNEKICDKRQKQEAGD